MDKTTAIVVSLGIIALVFVAFFAVFRKSGKGKIKGPFGTGLEVEGSNEPQQTRIKEVEPVRDAPVVNLAAAKTGTAPKVSINPGGGQAKAKAEKEKAVEASTNIHNVTLKEIRDRIEATPPFQKDDVIQYYLGLTIDWQTMLCSVRKKTDGDSLEAHIMLSVHDQDDHYVGMCSCDVALNKYPELKVLHEKHPIRIVGRISKVDSGAFGVTDIEEPKLFFLPAK